MTIQKYATRVANRMRKLLLRRRNFEVTQACQIFGITQQELEPFLVSGDGSRGRQFFFPEAMTSE